MEQQCWAQTLCTMREAVSLGIASRTARETRKTSYLEKEAGVWPMALERLPTPVLGAVFAYCLSVGWEPCVSQASYFLQSFTREQLCSWPQFSPGHPSRVTVHPHFPI